MITFALHRPGDRPIRPRLLPLPDAWRVRYARIVARRRTPDCPFCGGRSWLFETYEVYEDERTVRFPVWCCNNDACPSHADEARQGFFSIDDLRGGNDERKY